MLTPVPALEALFSPHRCLNQTSASSLVKKKGQMGGVRLLTVQLVGSALSVHGLGGQEQGLVVQIAVWGGRFVVRPEFCRAHVAAQGEQRLAQLPCNHRILEGAGSPGGRQGGEKKEKTPLVRCASASHPNRLLLYASTHSLYPASPFYRSLITLPLSPAPSLSSSLFYLRLVLPR